MIKPPNFNMKKQHTDPAQITAVVGWILQANAEHHIRQAILSKFPGANATKLIAAAVKEITEIGKEDPAFTHGWALAATKELTRKMIEVGDFANALRGIKQAKQIADTHTEDDIE